MRLYSSFAIGQNLNQRGNTELMQEEKNPDAQCLIKSMEKPPHLTDEDIDALNQSIKEGKIPIKFDSLFESDERRAIRRKLHANSGNDLNSSTSYHNFCQETKIKLIPLCY